MSQAGSVPVVQIWEQQPMHLMNMPKVPQNRDVTRLCTWGPLLSVQSTLCLQGGLDPKL